jgi:hypothetical protein
MIWLSTSARSIVGASEDDTAVYLCISAVEEENHMVVYHCIDVGVTEDDIYGCLPRIDVGVSEDNTAVYLWKQYTVFKAGSYGCTVKNVIDFPVPRRDVTYQTLPGRE